jgi:hypothetical protein
MELQNDWVSLNEIFYANHLDNIKKNYLEVVGKLKDKPQELKPIIEKARKASKNYDEQLKIIKNEVLSKTSTYNYQHFFIEFFTKKFKSFFPKKFKVLLFIDDEEIKTQNALLFEFESKNHSPQILLKKKDLSLIPKEFLENWQEYYKNIVSTLDSSFKTKTYAIFLTKKIWLQMNQCASTKEYNPWRLMVRYFDEKKARLYPMNLKTWIFILYHKLMMLFE